jgi:hypothetical protein
MFNKVSEEHTASVFYPEDGSDRFLLNFGNHLQDYTTSQPRGPQSTFSEPESLKSQIFIMSLIVIYMMAMIML